MNLIDALKSGKRFRRVGRRDHRLEQYPWIAADVKEAWFWPEAILADYEVEEKSVTVTKSQLLKVLGKVRETATINNNPHEGFTIGRLRLRLTDDSIEQICKELGLED